MLAIVILSAAVIALVYIFCLSQQTLFAAQYRIQSALDRVALAGSCSLNSQDRIGQMNNMVARSRQLVYASRQAEIEISKKRPRLSRLASSLLEDARNSARDLEAERKRLIVTTTKEANDAVEKEFTRSFATQGLRLPGLEIETPVLVDTRFGSLKNVDSNVAVLHGLSNLAEFDKERFYINNKPDLYVPGKDLKLPDEDSDLKFNLSSLPAYVNDVSAPARLVLPNTFQPGVNGQLQSAAQIEARATVKTFYGSSTISLISTATTYGGGRF